MAMKSTIAIINAALAADPSVSDDQRKGIAADLNGTGTKGICGEPPPRAYTREQVALLMGVNRKTITAYSRRGLLVPIYSGAGGKRAQAYTGESVAALLSGKANGKEVA